MIVPNDSRADSGTLGSWQRFHNSFMALGAVYPLLLGTGKRLFGEGTGPTGPRLTSSQAFPKGAIHLAYERAGKPKHGDLSVEAERTT